MMKIIFQKVIETKEPTRVKFMINALRTLLFVLFSAFPVTAIAVDLSSISRALEAIFDEYTSVHYQSLGRELDPELLASAGLKEVYRSDADGDQYVVYLLDAPVEILVYYFHNEQLLFLIDDNRKVDFDQVFSGVKNAKAGYTDEVKGPGYS